MHEMNMIHKKTNNCLDDVLENVLMFYNIHSAFMHLDSWDFIYFKKTNVKYFGDKINSNNTHWDVLKRYFPVDIKTYNHSDIKEKIDYFKNEIKLGPIILYLDAYNLPWTYASNSFHLRHYIIANDTLKEGLISCYDPYTSGNERHLINESIVFGKGTIFIAINKKYMKRKITCYELLSYLVNKGRNSEIHFYSSIKNFAMDLINIDVNLEIANYTNLHVVPLFMQLHSIASSRYNVAQIFKYMFKYYGFEELELFYNDMLSVYSSWKDIYKKIILSRNNSKYIMDAIEALYNISHAEEELHEKLEEWMSRNQSKLSLEVNNGY